MGPVGSVARKVGAGAAVGACLLAVLLMSAVVRPPTATTVYNPSPTAPDWLQPHPGRGATTTARLSIEDDGLVIRIDHTVTTRADDPLAEAARAGLVNGEYARLLFNETLSYEARSVDATPPTVTWASGQPTCTLRFTAHARLMLPAGVRRTVTLQDWTNAPAIARQHLTVIAPADLTIVGHRGSGLVRQNDHEAEFDGPPTGVEIAVYRGPEPSPEASTPARVTDDRPNVLLRSAAGWPSLVSALALALPWLVLSASTRRRGAPARLLRQAWPLRRIVGGAILAGGVLVFLSRPPDGDAVNDAIVALTSLPLVVAVTAVLLAGTALTGRARRRPLGWQPAGGAALLAVAAISLVLSGDAVAADHRESDLLVTLLIAVTAGALAGGLAGGPRWAPTGGAVACASWSLATVTLMGGGDDVEGTVTAAVLAGVGVALFLSPMTAALLPRAPRLLRVAVPLLGAGLFVPFWGIGAYDIRYPWYGTDFQDSVGPTVDGARLLQLALLAGTWCYLARVGRRWSAAVAPWPWALAFACLLSLTTDIGPSAWFNLLGVAVTAALWPWITGRRRSEKVRSLALVAPATHGRLMRAEIRRRIAELGAHDHYRSARTQLRERTVTLEEYDRNQRKLDEAATLRGKRTRGIPLSAALSTNAGETPSANALAAVSCAIPVAAAIAGVDLWNFLSSPDEPWAYSSGLELTWTLVRTFRWIGYAAIFGFFYPIVRGRTPVAKALALALLIAPSELLSVVGAFDFTPPLDRDGTYGSLLLGLAIRLGQVIVFSVVLGLAWERRLARLAGYGWDRMRNVRSLRTLATPATTVVVAVATALGTALAGTAVAALLSTPGPPAPTPAPPSGPPSASPTTTPSPGR
ncbi:hypothetical protein ACIA5A_15305 [Micromonospora sp. NPDC051300]|uniref:hypothetical protein n=1 Tax=Micromonospora sp. NPDC051300 TaxID=3364286 RepID=UPI0037B9CBFA